MSVVRVVTKLPGGVHGCYMAVTQGMGQGRVRGERMTLVAWRPSLILLKVKLTLDNLAYPIESKYVCTSLAV